MQKLRIKVTDRIARELVPYLFVRVYHCHHFHAKRLSRAAARIYRRMVRCKFKCVMVASKS